MLSEHNFGTLIGISGIAAGLVIALLAHSRYGYLTIGLLLVHMCIEWLEHAAHWYEYSSGELTLSIIHVSLDFIFLYQELRVHAERYFKTIFVAVIIAIAGIFIAGSNSHTDTTKNSTEESGSLIESFVVGGMFGCILSHLLRRKDECGHSHD